MKKLFVLLISVLLFASLPVRSQFYDGQTQPTKWRFWFQTQFSATGVAPITPTFNPFVGYKIDATKWLQFTGVYQYQVNKCQHIPAIWTTFNIKSKVYLQFRTGYNFQAKQMFETVSTSIMLPKNFNIDATWYNMFVDNLDPKAKLQGLQWMETYDKLQVTGSWKLKVKDRSYLAVNAGWVFRQEYVNKIYNSGVIVNARWYVMPKNWIQFQYDVRNKLITAAVAIQVDSFK